MYDYDRTAADNDAEAIKWYAAERKKVIEKALKEMSTALEAIMAEGRKKYPNLPEEKLMSELRKREQKYRDSLQG